MIVYFDIGKLWFPFNQKKSRHEPQIFISGDIRINWITQTRGLHNSVFFLVWFDFNQTEYKNSFVDCGAVYMPLGVFTPVFPVTSCHPGIHRQTPVYICYVTGVS